ncbi:MAG: hypothetical protein SF053_10010 [Bacteroidia bacterium]|nr:hypothetical protein [Bacteroidia bacterium]
MKINPNLITLGALLLAVFAAGAFFQGERLRKGDMKEQSKAIRDSQERINQRIDSVYTVAIAREKELLDQLSYAYRTLDSVRSKIAQREGNVSVLTKQIDSARENLKESIDKIQETDGL